MPLTVNLLGGYQLLDEGGRAITLPTRKAEALLAVLALRPGAPVPRERLAAMLWPESRAGQARGSLRQALSVIRKSIAASGAAGIEASGDQLVLDPAGVDVDAAAFERELGEGTPDALARALARYRGDLLDGFTLAEEPFEEWLLPERARLRTLAAGAFARLLEHHVEARDFEAGIALAERALALDRTSEPAYRALMRLHADAGSRSNAARSYERCRQALGEELGISPSAETEHLHRRLLAPAAEPAADAIASRPSIVVLPFANYSEDPAGEYFARGLVEDIITELSRFRSLAVMARHTSFAYQGDAKPAQAIGAELGVQYLLQGSVRRSASAARIAAQLVDAASGEHLWAHRYDIDLEEIDTVQDEISQHVVSTLTQRIEDRVLAQAKRKSTENLQAYDCWLRGMDCLRRGSRASDAEARTFFRRALELDAQFARAHSGLSLASFNEWSCQAWHRWEETQREAYLHAAEAVRLDDADHVSHCILGKVHLYRREFDQAERHLNRAIALNPNDADNLAHNAIGQAFLGNPALGLELGASAMHLNPKHPSWYHVALSLPYFVLGRLDESIELASRAPDAMLDTRAYLAAAHAMAGREREAREQLDRFLGGFRENVVFGREPKPGEALEWVLHVNPYRNPEHAAYLADGLRAAGL